MKNIRGPLLVHIHLINASKKSSFGELMPGQGYGPYPDLKSLYKAMKAEWGGKVMAFYQDTTVGNEQIGWVFSKHVKYTDCNDTCLREVWVKVVKEVEPSKAAVYQTVPIGSQ